MHRRRGLWRGGGRERRAGRRGRRLRPGEAGYLAGAVAARTGDEMSGPALLLLGAAATGSATTGAALLAGLTVSAAIGGPVVGVLLDRGARPGRLLAGALAAYAAGIAACAVLLGRVPLPVVVAVAMATGVLGPVLSAGWTAQLPRVFGPEVSARGTALDAMTFSAAGLVGPALAGLLASAAGAGAGVAAAAALIALAATAAPALPAATADRSAPRAPRPQGSARAAVGGPGAGRRLRGADVVAGVRAIAGNRPLLRATAVSSVSLAASGMFVVSTPLLGARLLGGPENGVVLLSLMAVFALCANAVLAGRPTALRPEAVLVACVLAQAAGTAVAAVAPGAAVLVVAVAVIGAAEGPQLTALFAIRHREAPDHLRAQVFATGASLKITAFAVGSALAGPLADASPVLCLATAAAVHAAAGVLHALLGARGRREGARCGRRPLTGGGWRRCGPRSG
ncbi:MFS transporter [Nocardiopsis mangrovi]|uniref:MFS transporter n=1 Tax=Nocardiopsis mangrovi TaxID=1179818 RepID=A0ABV9DQL2_9ACTN